MGKQPMTLEQVRDWLMAEHGLRKNSLLLKKAPGNTGDYLAAAQAIDAHLARKVEATDEAVANVVTGIKAGSNVCECGNHRIDWNSTRAALETFAATSAEDARNAVKLLKLLRRECVEWIGTVAIDGSCAGIAQRRISALFDAALSAQRGEVG